jgi:hypothetical protein
MSLFLLLVLRVICVSSNPSQKDFLSPTLSVYKIFEQMNRISPPIVPYQRPSLTPKSPQEIRALGEEYFPNTLNSTDIALSIYDWSQPDFSRINSLLTFSRFIQDFEGFWYAFEETPIKCFIFGPPFPECSKDIFFVFRPLNLQWNLAQVTLITYGLSLLPANASSDLPALYRGDVEFTKNLFCAQFVEFYNATQSNLPGDPWINFTTPLPTCVQDYFTPGSFVTTRVLWSTTSDYSTGLGYSRGVFFTILPPPPNQNWGGKNIAAFTISTDDEEYLYPPNSQFQIFSIDSNSESIIRITLCDTVCH